MALPYNTYNNLTQTYVDRCAEIQRQANANPHQQLRKKLPKKLQSSDIPTNDASSSYITLQPVPINGGNTTNSKESDVHVTGVEMLKEWIDVSELDTKSLEIEKSKKRKVASIHPKEAYTLPNSEDESSQDQSDNDVEIITENNLHWADVNVEEFIDPEEQKEIQRRQEAEEKHLQTTGKYKCYQCPYKTKWKSNLSKHIVSRHQTSNEIKWYNCTKCSYKGKTSEYLRTHLRSHLTTDNAESFTWYQCSKCPSKYKNKQTLKTHVICVHANPDEIKWYKCDQCDFKCKFNIRLKNHILYRHTEASKIPWYRCEECDYKGKTKKGLRRHMYNMHTDIDKINWVICEFCGFETTTTKYLNQHIRNRHSKQNDDESLDDDRLEDTEDYKEITIDDHHYEYEEDKKDNK